MPYGHNFVGIGLVSISRLQRAASEYVVLLLADLVRVHKSTCPPTVSSQIKDVDDFL